MLAQAASRLIVAGVSLLVGVLFLDSGKGKPFEHDGKAPEPLRQQFEGTFPGGDAAWVIIGILELAIFLLLVLRPPPSSRASRLHAGARGRG
ncbi:MAG TPA: hypothetical protein VN213_17455 [Solirubrobacteraceae bacterium]|nr:hypothetical protein [Solirubrobacteraceae bacterium]